MYKYVNDKLSPTWYYKPTDTGKIINYHALAPKCYKRSVNLHESMEKVKMILQPNQYLQSFYDPIDSNTIKKFMSPKENQKNRK